MERGRVLIVGCADSSNNVYDSIAWFYAHLADNTSGLKSDEKAVTAQNLPVTTISTGSAVRHGEGIIEIIETTASTLQDQINGFKRNTDIKVIKIGQ